MTTPDHTNAQVNARARKPPWKRNFLTYLSSSGNVSASAEAAGTSRRNAYKARYSSEAFAAKWDEAIAQATDKLELEARRRAVSGVDEPIYYKGQLVTTIKKYSDNLLITLLKAHRPEKFRERFEHTGPDGGPLRIDSTVHHPDPEVLAEILSVREQTGDMADDEPTLSEDNPADPWAHTEVTD